VRIGEKIKEERKKETTAAKYNGLPYVVVIIVTPKEQLSKLQ